MVQKVFLGDVLKFEDLKFRSACPAVAVCRIFTRGLNRFGLAFTCVRNMLQLDFTYVCDVFQTFLGQKKQDMCSLVISCHVTCFSVVMTTSKNFCTLLGHDILSDQRSHSPRDWCLWTDMFFGESVFEGTKNTNWPPINFHKYPGKIYPGKMSTMIHP